MEYLIEGRTIVRFGRINDEICDYMDIRSAVFFADIFWSEVLLAQKVDEVQVQELSRFPVVRRDLALVVADDISFSAIENVSRGKLGAVLKQINLFDVYRNSEVLGEGQKSYAVSFLLSDTGKTFSDQEVDHLIKDLLNELGKRVGARLR